MPSELEVICFLVGFVAFGFLINHTGNALYWAWMEWRNRGDR